MRGSSAADQSSGGDLRSPRRLVNNAGILRDRMMVNMSEADWDAVIQVHLKGTFAPTHFAAEHFRERSKAGEDVQGRIINTTSPSGLFGNVGQTNYGAAKAGIAALHRHLGDGACALWRHRQRDRADSPDALDRRPGRNGGSGRGCQKGPCARAHRAVAVWLGSTESSSVTGRIFGVWGPPISVAEGWAYGPAVEGDGVWEPAALSEVLPGLATQAAANATMMGTRP